MPDPTTDRKLRETQRDFAKIEKRYHASLDARNQAICAALDSGWTHNQIAQTTGLTRGRIGHIATRHTREDGMKL